MDVLEYQGGVQGVASEHSGQIPPGTSRSEHPLVGVLVQSVWGE